MGKAGATDEALDLLETVIAAGWGVNDFYLDMNPEWDFIRAEPRFQALVETARLQREALAKP